MTVRTSSADTRLKILTIFLGAAYVSLCVDAGFSVESITIEAPSPLLNRPAPRKLGRGGRLLVTSPGRLQAGIGFGMVVGLVGVLGVGLFYVRLVSVLGVSIQCSSTALWMAVDSDATAALLIRLI
jgi:hypothetical protein